jgi:hypothetical protein
MVVIEKIEKVNKDLYPYTTDSPLDTKKTIEVPFGYESYSKKSEIKPSLTRTQRRKIITRINKL